jgi:hypothetical protein
VLTKNGLIEMYQKRDRAVKEREEADEVTEAVRTYQNRTDDG